MLERVTHHVIPGGATAGGGIVGAAVPLTPGGALAGGISPREVIAPASPATHRGSANLHILIETFTLGEAFTVHRSDARPFVVRISWKKPWQGVLIFFFVLDLPGHLRQVHALIEWVVRRL